MAKGVWLVLASALAFVASQQDKYTDENRPYKFGFNIEGYQHRKEEKDEKGIIKGEYGFITADGYYRITVYATDENGAFRIISMKNIYVGFPPEDPTTTPAPVRQQGQKLNLKFGELPTRPSGTTKPVTASQVTFSAVTTTTPPVPSTPKFGQAACSSCFLPPPTTQKPQQPPISQAQPGGIRSPSGFTNTGGQLNKSGLGGRQPGGNPVYTPQNQGAFQGGNTGSTRRPFGSSTGGQPPGQGAFQGGNTGNTRRPFGSTTGGQPPGLNNAGQPFASPGSGIQPTGPGVNTPNQINAVDINNRFSPERLGQKDKDIPASIQRPVDLNGQRGDKIIPNNQRNNDRPSIPGQESEGLPPGVSEDDIKDLLYTFNYTVGFHGHHEDGYVSGNKRGDYFFDGRDGTERRVEYIANEFGYQPNITLIPLADNDIRKPKEETEKDFGLKGYEFKWFRTP